MLAALQQEGPVIFLEHKLLSEQWLEFLGTGGRETVQIAVPAEGAHGPVPSEWQPIPLGRAVLRRAGSDVTLVSVGAGVHHSLEAAEALAGEGISAAVLDLRTLSPMDETSLCEAVAATRRLVVVDEDYERFGLSGELAAIVLEAGIPVNYRRVCTRTTIPYARHLEEQTLPGVRRICEAARQLVSGSRG